ncbi:hypothetical protein D9611_009130 [Ephemerocybe angulata]|uniref:Uncharacterized protein n=1 Tax=Ephemerocybe angulata TaxID=980116 RepID=A0A8H5CDC6_9AGAR|nr:hypothetical protein D9611_009130 [Tulosesus angulatus]
MPRGTRPIPAEIYVGSMLSYGMGLACWNTKTHSGDVGPVLGDVGTFSAQDGFAKIFNLWDDEESINLTVKAYAGLKSYKAPVRRFKKTKEGRLRRGEIVKSPGVGGNVIYRPDYSDISNFEIRCTSQHGAALMLTSAADQEDLDHLHTLRDHILKYPELFYRHANAIERLGQDESLYIITGSVKSNSCGLAAFGEPTGPDEHPVILANSSRQGQRIASWVWTNQGTANTQLSDPSLDGIKDQTLFLRGFKLDISSDFRSTLGGPASGGGRDEGKSGGEGNDRRTGGEYGDGKEGGAGVGTGGNAGHGGPSFGGGSNGTLGSSSSQFRGNAVQVQSFPDSSRRRSCHPCDIINECLLQATSSSFALSHDDDWLPFLKGRSIWESSPPGAPPLINSYTGVCVIQGVACLVTNLEALRAIDRQEKVNSWLGGAPPLRNWASTTGAIHDRPLFPGGITRGTPSTPPVVQGKIPNPSQLSSTSPTEPSTAKTQELSGIEAKPLGNTMDSD